MKILTLIRHAKSSWKYDVKDIERPLKSSGITDAKLVSNSLENDFLSHYKWYSSPANRAFSTAKIFAETLNFPLKNVQISDDLYDFGGHKLITFVKSIPNSEKNVVVFGHNHAFTDFVNTYGNKAIDNLPTTGLVVLRLPIEKWVDLKPGITERFIRPKELRF